MAVLAVFGFSICYGGSFIYTTIEPPDYEGGMNEIVATGINNSGVIVGWYMRKHDTSGFIFDNGVYSNFNSGMNTNTWFWDINNNGTIVGSSPEGSILNGTTWTRLEYPCDAKAINDVGVIVGYCHDGTTYQGFILDGNALTSLDYPGALGTYPYGINNQRMVVGYYYGQDYRYHGFLFSDGVYTTIDYPGATSTHIVDINNEGVMVGISNVEESIIRLKTYIVQNGNFTILNYPASLVTEAWGINDSGMVVGTYHDQNSVLHGFLAVPVTEIGIDIKPGSKDNPISSKDRGTLPVAILGNGEFDALEIMNINTIAFGRTGDENSIAFCSPDKRDVNKDGYRDLVCFFWIQRTGFQCGDTQGVLKGTTQSGVSVEGKNMVKIIPCR